MIFQQVNINNGEVNKKFWNMCNQYSDCIGCPAIGGKPVNIDGQTVVCETGKNKQTKP